MQDDSIFAHLKLPLASRHHYHQVSSSSCLPSRFFEVSLLFLLHHLERFRKISIKCVRSFITTTAFTTKFDFTVELLRLLPIPMQYNHVNIPNTDFCSKKKDVPFIMIIQSEQAVFALGAAWLAGLGHFLGFACWVFLLFTILRFVACLLLTLIFF